MSFFPIFFGNYIEDFSASANLGGILSAVFLRTIQAHLELLAQ